MMTTENKVLTLGHVGMGTGTVEPFDAIYGKGLLVSPDEIKKGAEIDALLSEVSPLLGCVVVLSLFALWRAEDLFSMWKATVVLILSALMMGLSLTPHLCIIR
jgi:hypothetical protein